MCAMIPCAGSGSGCLIRHKSPRGSRQPSALIEVDVYEQTRLIQEHPTDAREEGLAGVIAAGKGAGKVTQVSGMDL